MPYVNEECVRAHRRLFLLFIRARHCSGVIDRLKVGFDGWDRIWATFYGGQSGLRVGSAGFRGQWT